MDLKSSIKWLVTICLIAYLMIKLDINLILSTISSMNLVLILVTLPLIVLMYGIRTVKWQLLLETIDIRISFWKALKIFLIGTFYGSLTPGRAGELSRSLFLAEEKSKTIPTVIFDRIIDVFCLLLLSVASVVLYFNNDILIYLIIVLSLFFIIGTVILVNEKSVKLIYKLIKVKDEQARTYSKNMSILLKNKKVILITSCMTLFYYAINILVFWLLLKSIDLGIKDIVAVSLPVIVILANIPVSISGIGVRELVSVMIFKFMNEQAAYGFAASMILYLLTTLAPGLVGSIFTLSKERDYAPAEQ